MEFPTLTNQLLIAMPSLRDRNFYQTVTLICEHSEEGALGIIINRPLETRMGEIFDQLDLGEPAAEIGERCVLSGGPMDRERGFVLHRPCADWDSTLQVSGEVGITTSRDILAAMASGDGPEDSLLALGYAGWGAGQLEAEMAANAWLSVPADADIIFETPYEVRWHAAARLLGVDLDRLSGEAGHA